MKAHGGTASARCSSPGTQPPGEQHWLFFAGRMGKKKVIMPSGEAQGATGHPRSPAPLKKRKVQTQTSPAHTSQHLLMPLKSRLEDKPVTPRGEQDPSSADFSEFSEGSPPHSSDEGSSSSEEDSPREATPPAPPKADKFILDNRVNFMMGSGGKQVKADYNKPSPPSPVRSFTCTLLVELLQRVLSGDQAATIE